MGLRILKLGLVSMALSTLVQCGSDDTISGKVKFTVIPKNPITISTDWTLNPGDDNEKQIKGPWFGINYTVQNTSDKTITIQSLSFTVTAIDNTGSITNQTLHIDPADYELALGHEPSYLVEVAAGDSVTPTYKLYVGGLDKNVASGVYSVTVDVNGWVGTPALPESRLTKSVSFSTR